MFGDSKGRIMYSEMPTKRKISFFLDLDCQVYDALVMLVLPRFRRIGENSIHTVLVSSHCLYFQSQ